MNTLNDIINIANNSVDVVKKESIKNICVVIDVSGSTGSPFSNRKTVLEKEIEIAEQLILTSPNNHYTVVSFDDDVKIFEVNVLIDEMMTNIHTFGMRSGTSTYTDKAFAEIIKMKKKLSHIVLLTDGQTNSSEHILKEQMEIFNKNNISVEIIAVSNSSINMDTLTQNEEQKIPGMDLINYLGNSISNFSIYNKYHIDIPYIGASTSRVGKNCVTFMQIPITQFIPDFLRSFVINLKDNQINWGTNQMEFKKLLSEIGKLISTLFVSFPESNLFVEDIIYKLNELNVPTINIDRIQNIIKYGFDCTRNKKPILYTNFEAHVKESVVKKNEFADAITLLKKNGTTLNFDMSISIPYNGLIVLNKNSVPLNKYLGNYNKSGDKFNNYYFGIGVDPQAIRIGMREFCGFLGVKNPVGSHSVIFYILKEMSLLYINGLSIDDKLMNYYRELAIHQTSLETIVAKNKYSGIGCYNMWKNGNVPQMHYSDTKTHCSLYTDVFVNPLRLNEPLWWALMMSMLGIFDSQLNIYEESLKGLQIEPNEKEFLNWVKSTFQTVVNGNIQVVIAEKNPTSLFTLSEFENDDQVYVLKDHGNCKTRTYYSKEEIDNYVMKPENGCCWCRYKPLVDDFERVTFEDPIIKIEKAMKNVKPLVVNNEKLKSLNLPPNVSLSTLSMSSPVSDFRMIRINMIGITGSGKSTFSKRIFEMITEKGGKCIILNADKWSKRGVKGKEIVHKIQNEMNEFKKMSSKLKVVIVDICNENGPQKVCFNIDFSNYEEFNFMPNMIPTKFNEYEAWCLRNVLNRKNFSEDTNYWLNPVSAGVNTCIKVHKAKTYGVRKFCNINSPSLYIDDSMPLVQAQEFIKNNADLYEIELRKSSIDNDINNFFHNMSL